MYAHQVIDSLESEFKTSILKNNNNFIQETSMLIDGIKNSQKFHVDTVDNFSGFCKKEGGIDAWHFTDVKMPYDICYFDWSKDNYGPFKYGCLSINDKQDKSIIHIVMFLFTKEHSMWSRGFYFYRIKLSNNLQKNVEIDTKPTIIGSLLCETTPQYNKRIIQEEEISVLGMLNYVLMFLDCKNIGLKKVPPPEALNRKRKKYGKTELYTYHTLILKPIGKKQESIPRDLWNNRIHLCRGHFKTYTKEKPLFGNITGRFWWQPIVRGKNKKGVIMKDYKIRKD